VLYAQNTPPNNYIVHNLVSDLPGIADKQDAKLVNPWGNGFGAGPFWLGDNRSGVSTLYDGTGTATALVVNIPAAGGGVTGGPVTGVIANTFSSNAAVLDVASGKPASFLFCSEDGIISGWNSSVDSTHAKVLFDNSKSGAVYKGCALGGTSAAPLLFAANFNSGAIDVFDGNVTPVVNSKAFVNPAVPAGFAPFNVQNISGTIFVTYAKQDGMKHHDVAGAGNGYLAMFDQAGNLLANLIAQGALNSPWGMAIAPSTFVPFGGALLVGNFGDGKINAYNATTGKPLGALNDTKNNTIAIPGLWSLNFGAQARNADPGTLYFTAGIGGGPNNDPLESHGLFGSIQAAPSFTTATVESGASFLASPVAPNTWMTIKGSGLSTTTVNAQLNGNAFPTTVNGVSVSVNGEPAGLNFVSSTQVNFLVPVDIQPGNTQVKVTNNSFTTTVPVTADLIAPGLFILGTANGISYVAATRVDGSLIGPTTLISGKTTPAAPGDTIVIYGTGFGQGITPIPNEQVISSAIPLPVLPTIAIDGFVANVTFGGITQAGLYQFNVVVPQAVHPGDDLVVALLGNGETQANAFITIAAH
jgi:uncharacterized protein (TIGR03118 family)